MKQYLDIEIGPLRNISDALSNDLQEQSINQIQHSQDTNLITPDLNLDVWTNLYQKINTPKD